MPLTARMATALKKVQRRIAFAWTSAAHKRNALSSPTFVSFAKSGSNPEAGQPLKSAEPTILVITQPTSLKAVAFRRSFLTPRHVLVTWVKKFLMKRGKTRYPGKLIHHPDKPDGVSVI